MGLVPQLVWPGGRRAGHESQSISELRAPAPCHLQRLLCLSRGPAGVARGDP